MTSKTRLFVGSIPYRETELTVKTFFEEEAGKVVYIKLLRHKETGLSRGFAFIEMATEDEADNALALDGREFAGRPLVVREAVDNESYVPKFNREG